MSKRKRVSSDGMKLFNMAIMTAPSKSKIRQMLSCLFTTPYDDRLEEMCQQCRSASEQLYSYTHYKDIDVNKLIDNSIFNVVHAMLMKNEELGTRRDIRQNYMYFMDVAKLASRSNDHNTAILIRAALMHHSIKQLGLKPRKSDQWFFKDFEEQYGSFRDCYKQHLLTAMNNEEYETWIPSLMVLNMHRNRHRAFSTIGRCKVQYYPNDIQSRIGMFNLHHYYPGEKMPLYEQPATNSSTDLILMAQYAK
jgi:hypothetical protein